MVIIKLLNAKLIQKHSTFFTSIYVKFAVISFSKYKIQNQILVYMNLFNLVEFPNKIKKKIALTRSYLLPKKWVKDNEKATVPPADYPCSLFTPYFSSFNSFIKLSLNCPWYEKCFADQTHCTPLFNRVT